MSAVPLEKKCWPAGSLGEKLDELKRRFSAAGIENPATDAAAILCRALGWDRARLHAHPKDILPGEAASRVAEAASRREKREPLAYILGEREFWSLPFRVAPGSLIPRPETELIVERAVALLREYDAPRILDLGTGSGAIAVAFAKEVPGARVVATDMSEKTLRLAQDNAAANGVAGRIAFHRADWLDGLPGGEPFDAVVSNPPYVPSGAIESLMPEVSRHEPREALDGGPDGMNCLRRIVCGAPGWLRSGGVLLLEMDPDQIPRCAVEVRLTRAFREPEVRQDLAGRDRVLEAVKA